MDMEDSQCDAAVKPPVREYCNVHNPCPGDGKLSPCLKGTEKDATNDAGFFFLKKDSTRVCGKFCI